MKKFSLFSLLLVFAFAFMIPTVYAHDIETDPDRIITFPLNEKDEIYSGSKIQVNDSYGEYKLYYQYVEMTDEVYEQYMAIHEEHLKFEEENRPADDAEPDVIEDYNKKFEEYEKSKQALLPAYVEDDWVESTDSTVKLDTTDIKEVKHYNLWVKITDENDENAVYDDQVITYDPNAVSEDDVPSPETSDNIILIGVGAILIAGIMFVSYRKVNS